MTDTDIDCAIVALQRWFQSQEIDPQEAAYCMIKLMSFMLIERTTIPQELEESLEIVSCTMRYEAFNYLRLSNQ